MNEELASYLSQNLWATVYGGPARTVGPHVGMELEVEGENLPVKVPLSWRITRDGSLRGNSAEYVSAKPIPEGGVDKVLTKLWDSFKASDTKLNQSYRTSFHVHYNVQDLSILQVLNVFFGYLICEPILETVAGENRVNNVFCLTPRENSVMFRHMYEELSKGHSPIQMFMGDALRYSSINMCSLAKFGTIENRLMSGLTELDKASGWTKAVIAIGKYFSNPAFIPSDIVEMPSIRGLTGLMTEVFQDEDVRKYLNVDKFENNANQSYKVYEACRQIQAIAYDFQDLFKQARELVNNPKVVKAPPKPKQMKFYQELAQQIRENEVRGDIGIRRGEVFINIDDAFNNARAAVPPMPAAQPAGGWRANPVEPNPFRDDPDF